ncbi:MAG: thiamine-phosphate kinase [Pseudomonadota bacterium]
MPEELLSQLGESGAIRMIAQAFPCLAGFVKKGIGDDCAVLEFKGCDPLLITTDMLVEGVHFKEQTLSYEDLGWKALAVSVSDIAAMGGRPATALLSIGLRPSTPVSAFESFIHGFRAMAIESGVALVGGDTVSVGKDLVVSVTLLGTCRRGDVVLRSGARAGDDIWVTGALGDSAAGLEVLLLGGGDINSYSRLVARHQRPFPRFGIGNRLAERRIASAMIDISDGISKDLLLLCEASGVGGVVEEKAVPFSEQLLVFARRHSRNPLDFALHGGEDYELAFTASPQYREEIKQIALEASDGTPARIGSIIEEPGLWLERGGVKARMSAQGYFHFNKAR